MSKNQHTIIHAFQRAGYETYYSGPSARHILQGKDLGEQPETFLATEASLQEIRNIAESQLNITCQVYHKANTTVTELLLQDQYRIHPFIRTELNNGFAARSYTTDVEEDAQSQNLTINSLYTNEDGEILLDFTGGLDDLKEKTIRFVGNPYDKISEDRLYLFDIGYALAELGSQWDVEYHTYERAQERGLEIAVVGPESISKNFTRLMQQTQRPSLAFRFFLNIGLLSEIIPEMRHTVGLPQSNKSDDLDLFNHIMYALDSIPKDQHHAEILRWSSIFHDLAKPYTTSYDEKGKMHFFGHEKIGAIFAKRFFERYQFSKDLSYFVYMTCKNHLLNTNPYRSDQKIQETIQQVGEKHILNLIAMRRADRYGTGREDISMKHINLFKEKVKNILNGEGN